MDVALDQTPWCLFLWLFAADKNHKTYLTVYEGYVTLAVYYTLTNKLVGQEFVTLETFHAFLYISLPSLHDYDVKPPNFTFYRKRELTTTNLSYSF